MVDECLCRVDAQILSMRVVDRARSPIVAIDIKKFFDKFDEITLY